MVPDGCFEEAFIDGGRRRERQRPRLHHVRRPAAREAHRQGRRVRQAATRRSTRREPEAYAVYGYVAAQVALDAHRAAPARRTARRCVEAVAAIKDSDGALGTWSFDENGDTTLTTMSGNTVKDGKFEFVDGARRSRRTRQRRTAYASEPRAATPWNTVVCSSS